LCDEIYIRYIIILYYISVILTLSLPEYKIPRPWPMLPADTVYQGDRLAYILKSTITMSHMM